MNSPRAFMLVLAGFVLLSLSGCDFSSGGGKCRDRDGDGWWSGCQNYTFRRGPDCDDRDPNNWKSCQTCQDADGDGWFLGCDAYVTIDGPDCGDADINNWVSCSTCLDGDGDGWFSGCDAYVTIDGPDCYEGGGKDHCVFLNNDAGPYTATLGLAGQTAEESYAYPGVSAARVNHQVTLHSPGASAAGNTVEFDLCNTPGPRIERLWMTLKIKGDADALTQPDNYNAAQEMVFAIGPLNAGECRHLSLSVDPWGGANFAIAVRFLQIAERVSFLSDLGDPGANPYILEIYSMTPTGQDLFRHTFSPMSIINQASPPAGEWTAYTITTQALCGATTTYPAQAYLMHPDGANLTHISAWVFNAASPSFNPTGKLVAYSCIFDCHVDNHHICLYNLETGENKVLYRGNGFYQDKVFVPKWSPDGKYIAVLANGPNAATSAYTVAVGEVDPLTGDSVTPLQTVMHGLYYQQLPPDNAYYLLVPVYFNWGPDSAHGAMYCTLYRWNGSAWARRFDGVAIFDLLALLNGPSLPAVPVITRVVPTAGQKYRYPFFSPGADRLYFDQPVAGGHANIVYTNLTNYTPAAAQTVFYSDGNFNRVPTTFPPILDVFYAGRP